jgi:hypothetical protein
MSARTQIAKLGSIDPRENHPKFRNFREKMKTLGKVYALFPEIENANFEKYG